MSIKRRCPFICLLLLLIFLLTNRYIVEASYAEEWMNLAKHLTRKEDQCAVSGTLATINLNRYKRYTICYQNHFDDTSQAKYKFKFSKRFQIASFPSTASPFIIDIDGRVHRKIVACSECIRVGKCNGATNWNELDFEFDSNKQRQLTVTIVMANSQRQTIVDTTLPEEDSALVLSLNSTAMQLASESRVLYIYNSNSKNVWSEEDQAHGAILGDYEKEGGKWWLFPFELKTSAWLSTNYQQQQIFGKGKLELGKMRIELSVIPLRLACKHEDSDDGDSTTTTSSTTLLSSNRTADDYYDRCVPNLRSGLVPPPEEICYSSRLCYSSYLASIEGNESTTDQSRSLWFCEPSVKKGDQYRAWHVLDATFCFKKVGQKIEVTRDLSVQHMHWRIHMGSREISLKKDGNAENLSAAACSVSMFSIELAKSGSHLSAENDNEGPTVFWEDDPWWNKVAVDIADIVDVETGKPLHENFHLSDVDQCDGMINWTLNGAVLHSKDCSKKPMGSQNRCNRSLK